MRNNLNRYLNQKGFHSQFKPIKKLGKGNFATVYQVIRIEDGKKLAVKAFSKANTFST
jgi:serine/threonine protein kinase